jgi:hypothetical protein
MEIMKLITSYHKQLLLWVGPFFLNIVFLTTCSSQNTNDNKEDFKQIVKDSIIKDIPMNSIGKPEFMYQYIRIWEKDNNLPNIENGVDSLEVRFWYHSFVGDTLQLIRIVHDLDKWIAKDYNFWIDTAVYWKNTASKEAYRSKIIELLPKGGWNNFIPKVFSLGLKTLPTDSRIKNYKCDRPINFIHFEVATKNSYRLYSYCEPLANSKNIKEAKNVIDILELVEKELGFKPIIALQ